MANRTERLKAIREWSADIRHNPDAYGPSISKTESIHFLVDEIGKLEAACKAALEFIEKVRSATWYARSDEARKVAEQLREAMNGSPLSRN